MLFTSDGGLLISDSSDPILLATAADFRAPAPAVPEPETYAMTLAGLGLLGFAARHRKQKKAVAA